MARLFDDAGSDKLQIDVAPVLGVPLTIACWVRTDDITVGQAAIWIGDKDVEKHYFELVVSADPGIPVKATTRAGGAAASAISTTGLTVDTWHHICAVFTTTLSRDAYIDGGSKGSDATNLTPAGLDRVTIGGRGDSTPSNFFSGRIAEPIILNVALSPNEVLALFRKVKTNHIRPVSIKGYWPLWGLFSPEIDLSGQGNALIITGATKANHAPLTLFVPPWAATVPLIETAVPPVEAGPPRFGQVITKTGGQPQFGQPITRSDSQPKFGQVITRTDDDLPQFGQVIVQADGEPEFGQTIVVPTTED